MTQDSFNNQNGYAKCHCINLIIMVYANDVKSFSLNMGNSVHRVVLYSLNAFNNKT